MKKYRPIFEYLTDVPSTKNKVIIKLADIEKILGATLPPSASEYVEWWASQDYGSQAPSWINAGFLVDNVDLQRGAITFKRGSKSSSQKINHSKNAINKTRVKKEPCAASYLLNSGFEVSGEWRLSSERLELVGNIPKEPGVYAFVVEGYINYIGVATRDLQKRIKFYINPGKSQATNLRINPLIKKCINSSQSVQILTVCPGTTIWNGITMDITSSLELALIRDVQPSWNISGVN